ncbi:hypothetical protein WT98_29665 [Burkholderia territorii]|nr:hypothetical protein WT98_29665 [Burkholderia territorii]
MRASSVAAFEHHVSAFCIAASRSALTRLTPARRLADDLRDMDDAGIRIQRLFDQADRYLFRRHTGWRHIAGRRSRCAARELVHVLVVTARALFAFAPPKVHRPAFVCAVVRRHNDAYMTRAFLATYRAKR